MDQVSFGSIMFSIYLMEASVPVIRRSEVSASVVVPGVSAHPGRNRSNRMLQAIAIGFTLGKILCDCPLFVSLTDAITVLSYFFEHSGVENEYVHVFLCHFLLVSSWRRS